MATTQKKFVKYIALPIYGRKLIRKNNVKLIDDGLFDNFKGPAIILANHCHSLDPLFAYSIMKPHVRWIAGAHLFKTRIKRFALAGLADCIPKQQGRSDLHTIKLISNALKKNEIIGIFAEGTRTWDGNYEDLNSLSTAKLIKIFKVSVIFLNFEGAYNLAPRWAEYSRKGGVNIRVVRHLKAEDFKGLKTKDIEKIVHDSLNFSATSWEEKNKVPYYNRNGAVGIERLIFRCPICKSKNSIEGEGNIIECNHCHNRDYLDPYLELHTKRFSFKNLVEWNNYQKNIIAQEVSHGTLDYPEDEGYFIRKGVGDHFELISKHFTVKLDGASIIIKLKNGDTLDFKLKDIESCIISVQQTIELYYQETLYSIRMHSFANALKYLLAWQAVEKE